MFCWSDSLQSSFQELKDFPGSFWLTIFVEGTRITPDKLLAAQEFAILKGLPVPKNVLIPRTKVTTQIQCHPLVKWNNQEEDLLSVNYMEPFSV